MASPSPPLFPVPQTTAIFLVVSTLSVNQSTNAREALSIKSMEATGSVRMVCASNSLICLVLSIRNPFMEKCHLKLFYISLRSQSPGVLLPVDFPHDHIDDSKDSDQVGHENAFGDFR